MYKERLKKIRESNNYTQEQLARIINKSRSAYATYETEFVIMPIKHLIILCDFLNVSIDYIFGLTEIKEYEEKKNLDFKIAGNRLKQFRNENNISQGKLAIVLKCSPGTIAGYDRGRYLIATPFLYDLCKKYNISADYLLGKTDEPKYLNSTKK